MTPEQIEKHRKRFEEIARSKVDIASDGSGHYFLSHVHYMWQGYLLCAENMEVELPTKASTLFGEPNEHYNDGIESCKVLLEYQGIKVISVKHELDRNMECAMETKGFTVRSILV